MLKKLLYGKYTINNIPTDKLPYTSEEIFALMYNNSNIICFKYGEQLRILPYIGYNPDFLMRATKYQPQYLGGGEQYKQLSRDDVVLYQENPLPNLYASGKIICDIDNYINAIAVIDNAVIVNSKQVLLPFIVKAKNNQSTSMLKNLFSKILGKDFDKLILDSSLAETPNGITIETTNIQLVMQQLQDTKKKILEEAFLYLGIGSPAGKLAHESEQEVLQNEKITDLLDKVMVKKFEKFIQDINAKFDLNLTLEHNF